MKSFKNIFIQCLLVFIALQTFLHAENPKPPKAIVLTEDPQQVSTEEKNSAGAKTFAYKIKSDLYANKEVTVYYRIFLDGTGKPGPQAGNIIFQAPYTNLSSGGKYFEHSYPRDLVDKYGYTVYSFVVKGKLTYVEDHVKCHYYPESGSFDIAFKIQDFLTKKYGLQSKKLIIAGESGGSAMAELMGVHNPDKIDVIAFPGGRFFEQPKPDTKIAWFGTNTWGDIPQRKNAYRDLKDQMDSMGVKWLHCQTPPEWKEFGWESFHHALNPLAEDLLVEYIHATIDLRDQNKLFPPSAWPVQFDDNGEKLSMPSEKFLEIWKKIPHDAIRLADAKTATADRPIIFPAVTSEPKGVVLFFHDDIFEPDVILLDNLQYFSENGFIALSLHLGEDPKENLKKIEDLISYVEKEPKWNELPIFLSGSGSGGQLAATEAFHSSSKRIKAVAAISSPTDSSTDETSPLLAIQSSHIPTLLVYGDKDLELNSRNRAPDKMVQAAPDGEKQVTVKLVPQVEENLGREWFHVLEDICTYFSEQK